MVATLYVFEFIFVLICLILVLLILIQKGRGGGLASAFGGAGGQTAFGSKTGDVLTWATSALFALFLIFAVVLNLIANSIDKAHGGSASAVALSPADRSTLPKPQPAEPGIRDTAPSTPSMPVAPAAAVAAPAMPTTVPTSIAPAVSAPTTTPTIAPLTTPNTLP